MVAVDEVLLLLPYISFLYPKYSKENTLKEI